LSVLGKPIEILDRGAQRLGYSLEPRFLRASAAVLPGPDRGFADTDPLRQVGHKPEA